MERIKISWKDENKSSGSKSISLDEIEAVKKKEL